jgi:hypothetical protein
MLRASSLTMVATLWTMKLRAPAPSQIAFAVRRASLISGSCWTISVRDRRDGRSAPIVLTSSTSRARRTLSRYRRARRSMVGIIGGT